MRWRLCKRRGSTLNPRLGSYLPPIILSAGALQVADRFYGSAPAASRAGGSSGTWRGGHVSAAPAVAAPIARIAISLLSVRRRNTLPRISCNRLHRANTSWSGKVRSRATGKCSAVESKGYRTKVQKCNGLVLVHKGNQCVSWFIDSRWPNPACGPVLSGFAARAVGGMRHGNGHRLHDLQEGAQGGSAQGKAGTQGGQQVRSCGGDANQGAVAHRHAALAAGRLAKFTLYPPTALSASATVAPSCSAATAAFAACPPPYHRPARSTPREKQVSGTPLHILTITRVKILPCRKHSALC